MIESKIDFFVIVWLMWCSAFIGPLAAGYFQVKLGFEMCAVIFGSFSLVAVRYSATVTLFSTERTGRKRKYKNQRNFT